MSTNADEMKERNAIAEMLNKEPIPDEERVELVLMINHLIESQKIFIEEAHSNSFKRFLHEYQATIKREGGIEIDLTITQDPTKTSISKLDKKDLYTILKDLENKGAFAPDCAIFSKRNNSILNLFPLSFIKKGKTRDQECFKEIKRLDSQREKLAKAILEKEELETVKNPLYGTPIKLSEGSEFFSTPKKSTSKHKQPQKSPHLIQTPPARKSARKIYSNKQLASNLDNSGIIDMIQLGMHEEQKTSLKDDTPKARRKLFSESDSGHSGLNAIQETPIINTSVIADERGLNQILDRLEGLKNQLESNDNSIGRVDRKLVKVTNDIEATNDRVEQVTRDVTETASKIPDLEERISQLELKGKEDKDELEGLRRELDRQSNIQIVNHMMEFEIELARQTDANRAYSRFIKNVKNLGRVRFALCTNELILSDDNNKDLINTAALEDITGQKFRQVDVYKSFEGLRTVIMETCSYSAQGRNEAASSVIMARKTGKFKGIFGINWDFPIESGFNCDRGFSIWQYRNLIAGFGISANGYYFIRLLSKTSNGKAAEEKIDAVLDEEKFRKDLLYPPCPVTLLTLKESEINNENLRKLQQREKYMIFKGQVHEIPIEIQQRQRKTMESENLNDKKRKRPNRTGSRSPCKPRVIEISSGEMSVDSNAPRDKMKTNRGFDPEKESRWANKFYVSFDEKLADSSFIALDTSKKKKLRTDQHFDSEDIREKERENKSRPKPKRKSIFMTPPKGKKQTPKKSPFIAQQGSSKTPYKANNYNKNPLSDAPYQSSNSNRYNMNHTFRQSKPFRPSRTVDRFRNNVDRANDKKRMEENETKNYYGPGRANDRSTRNKEDQYKREKARGRFGSYKQSSNGHRFESRTERYYPEENPKRSVGRNWGRGRGRGKNSADHDRDRKELSKFESRPRRRHYS